MPNETDRFATYYRDQISTLDYARNRYYSSTLGRFMTPDPYIATASGANNPADPSSWNRYVYAENDPVNFNDPGGLMLGCPSGDWSNCGGGGSSSTFDPTLWNFVTHFSPTPINGFGPAPKGTPIKVANFSDKGDHQDAIRKVLNKIHNALSDPANSDCANWLEGGATLIGALVDNNTFGHGNFNVQSTAAFAGQVNADGTPTGVPVTAAFTVNDSGAFFNATNNQGNAFQVGARHYGGGTLQADASILVHELAHIIGAAGFLPDFNDQHAKNVNDKLVDTNCGGLIGGLQ